MIKKKKKKKKKLLCQCTKFSNGHLSHTFKSENYKSKFN